MKKFILFCLFAIGMFIMMPSTSSGSASPPGQVSFVVDHQIAAPVLVAQKGGELLVQGYNFIASEYILQKSNCTEGLIGIALQPPQSITIERLTDKHLHSINHPPLNKSNDIQLNTVTNHRFARDGLTCS